MRTSASLYPWDVVDDPAAPDRVADLGLDEVSLAATYHEVRGFTPWHPGRRVITAPRSAGYYRQDDALWKGRRLKPAVGEWVGMADSFGAAERDLRAAGLAVRAWVVLGHNDGLGSQYPDVAVENAFGDIYPWALCAANEEVQEFAATVVEDVVTGYRLDGIELEACGWYGFEHLSAHDKVQLGGMTAGERYLLSLCFCASCRAKVAQAGGDAGSLRHVVRAMLTAAFQTADRPNGSGDVWTDLQEMLGADLAGLVRDVRAAGADQLRAQVVDTARRARSASTTETLLDVQTDPFGMGSFTGIAPSGSLPAVDGLVYSAAYETRESLEHAHTGRPGAGARIPARSALMVSVLGDANPEALAAVADDAATAGITDLHIYHAGLGGPRADRRIKELVAAFGASQRARTNS